MDDSTKRGIIAWMARNSVAANLLMFVILFGGAFGAYQTKQEVFPDFEIDVVTVTVPYPGASPAEVEQGILLATEEAVRGLDGVKRVSSYASEGVGTVNVSLLVGQDPDKVLADVKNAVDRISSMPQDIERPTVALLSGRREVISMVISGDLPRETLHQLAEKARSGIIDTNLVTLVEVDGVRPREVSVEISRENLEAYGLDLNAVARQIRGASVELPGGGIDAASGEFLLRVADRRKSGIDFENVLIQGTAKGYTLRLGDIARVQDGYADTDQDAYFNGKSAVRVVSYRIGSETPSAVAAAVKEYIEVFKKELPETVEVTVLKDSSEMLEGRIDLLMRNAMTGLVLVLIILALFLNPSLAGWVALGIPISFMGAFLLMPPFDISINMVTLFAFIVTLGMVVDDAIVVGENIQNHVNQGKSRIDAAIAGAREMAKPVTFSILTTVAAFGPLFFVPGFMGKIFRFIPSIVVAVLLFSLIESFFVLPAHLVHAGEGGKKRWLAPLEKFHHRARDWLENFTRESYQPFLRVVLRNRYLAVSVALALLIVSLGTVGSGLLPFNFFPKLEGNEIRAVARLPYGVPLSRTQEVQRALEASWEQTINEVAAPGIVRGLYTSLGQAKSGRGRSESGSHVVTIEINLVPSEERSISALELSDLWAKKTPVLPGVEAVTFNSSTGPGGGAAVDVQLTHRDTTVLAAASEEVAQSLLGYKELKNVENTYAAGKPQLNFHLLPLARTVGLTGNDVARQMRSAFFGAEALREQRGRDEVKVVVRLPERQRSSEYDLERLPIRAPNGSWLPLSSVATFDRGRAATTIRREDGKRIVNIKAELAAGVKSSREVLTNIREELFPALRAKYPSLELEFTGSQRERSESLSSLGPNYILALFVIFTLLAIPFRSYLQPLIIMSAIPFGMVGAIVGHLVMGYSLSIISMFGVIALSGVVVNDSLVLIDSVNIARQRGSDAYTAIIAGGMRRLRPILLTSLTTFFGLAPMILETSIQARFLIPMAVSLGFGVLFATFIVLLVVPALYLIAEDIRALFLGGEPVVETDSVGAVDMPVTPNKPA